MHQQESPKWMSSSQRRLKINSNKRIKRRENLQIRKRLNKMIKMKMLESGTKSNPIKLFSATTSLTQMMKFWSQAIIKAIQQIHSLIGPQMFKIVQPPIRIPRSNNWTTPHLPSLIMASFTKKRSKVTTLMVTTIWKINRLWSHMS